MVREGSPLWATRKICQVDRKNPAQTEQFRNNYCCHSSNTRGERVAIYHVMYFEFKQMECSKFVWLAYGTVILLVIARRHRAAHEFMSSGPFRCHENDLRRRAFFFAKRDPKIPVYHCAAASSCRSVPMRKTNDEFNELCGLYRERRKRISPSSDRLS